MKNIAATFLALTYLLASVGCQSEFAPPILEPINGNKNIEDSADGKDASVAVSEIVTDCDFLQLLNFHAKYIRTNGYVDGEQYPKTLWLTSTAELNDYYEANKEQYYRDSIDNSSTGQIIGFFNSISEYDDTFFETNDLILVMLMEGSGSIRHEVTDVLLRPLSMGSIQHSIQPVIKRSVPESATDDIAVWHIIIEISKEYGQESSLLQQPIIS